MILYVDSLYASPYAMATFVALRTKACEFQEVTVDLAVGQANMPDYRARSLTSRVPTLVDEDFSLSESSAICEYLDQKLPGTPLYPQGLRPRARARQIQAWIRSDLTALRQDRSTEIVFFGARRPRLSSAAALDARKLLRVAGELVRPDTPHLFDAWSIVDVDLALMLNRLVMNGDPVPEVLAHYATAQWSHPAIQEWVAKPRPRLHA